MRSLCTWALVEALATAEWDAMQRCALSVHWESVPVVIDLCTVTAQTVSVALSARAVALKHERCTSFVSVECFAPFPDVLAKVIDELEGCHQLNVLRSTPVSLRVLGAQVHTSTTSVPPAYP
jgi:hypothetical protein